MIVRYRFILKHNTLGDVQIPITSFSARVRSNSASYLQITIMYTPARFSLINARSDGGILRIEKIFANSSEVITSVNIEDVRFDEGSVNKTISISGHRTYSNDSPTNVTLVKYSYIRHSVPRSIRCSVRNPVKPGDTVTAGTISFVADLVSIYANAQNSAMEITEETAEVTTTTTTTSSSTTTTTGPPP